MWRRTGKGQEGTSRREAAGYREGETSESGDPGTDSARNKAEKVASGVKRQEVERT